MTRTLGLGLAAMFFALSLAAAAEVKLAAMPEVLAMFDRKALPYYPYEARRAHAEGSGIFRMYINPDGTVRTVAVMKSTGNRFLDLAAAGGLYQWHAVPAAKPREVDMPVKFTLSRRSR